MENQVKTVYYANFNITFGDDNEPMLTHFIDIIYPAFQAGYKRGKEDERPNFYFTGVNLTEINDEIVLVGNYIKDDRISVYTTVQNQKLVSSPNEVETAPYSRFIIFLRNHRMALIKNEGRSPDVRSFQSTVKAFLKKYVRSKNKESIGNEKLPMPSVNIIAIPLQEDIGKILKNAKKILFLNFRFFPLNNDLNPLPMENNINQLMNSIESKTANVKFNSPQSKTQVARAMTYSNGLAEVTVKYEKNDGSQSKITNNEFQSSKKIKYHGNLQEKDDEYIISQIIGDYPISSISEENNSLYKRMKECLLKLIK